MSLKLSLDLPEDGAHVRTVRRIGRLMLEDQQVGAEIIEDVEMVLGELCTNVIYHAQSHEGKFQVVMEYFPDRIVIEVTDRGQGFSPTDAPPPGVARPQGAGEEPRFGGFGLPIVEMLADRLEILPADPHGTTVRAEKRLQ